MESVLRSLKENAKPGDVLKSLNESQQPKRGRDEISTAGAAASGKKKPQQARCTISGGTAQPPRVIGYRRTGANVDLSFRVEKRSFATHSQVLGPCSGLVRGLISTAGFDYRKPIDLPDGSSAAAFEALLDFFYDGTCSFPEPILDAVLEVAHHMQAEAALSGLLPLFIARVTPSNCLEMLRLGHRLSLSTVRAAAEQAVLVNFDVVRLQPGFAASVPLDLLRSLLAEDSLGVASEEFVFEAATRWIEAQTPAPSSSDVSALLRLVRYPSLPRSFVTATVIPHPLLRMLPGGAPAVLLSAYLDAHYGPASALSTPRHGVAPPVFSAGAPPSAVSPAKARRRSLHGDGPRGDGPGGSADGPTPTLPGGTVDRI